MALDVFKNASFAQNDDAMFETFVKLLAEENITTITSPTFKTAFFDLKRRIVGIPAWKNMSRNLKMVLRFHECGHALFSEVESFHDFIEGKYGRALSGIINVCEDDRNDRLTQKKFPGSKPYYKEGYKEIMARFWNDVDYDTASFADKLNLDSKAKDRFPLVPANETEAKLYFRFKNTQTVEEVIALAYDVYAYCKEEAKTDTNQNPGNEEQEQEQEQEDSEDQEQGESFGAGEQENQEEKSENEGTGGEEGDEQKDSDENEGEGDDSGEKSEGEKAEDGKETDSKPDDKNDFDGEANSDDTNFTQTNDQFKQAEQEIVNENSEEVKQERDYYGNKIDPVERIIILKSGKKNFVGFRQFNKDLSENIEKLRQTKQTYYVQR